MIIAILFGGMLSGADRCLDPNAKKSDSQASNERRRRFMEIALRRFAKDGYHVTKISDIVAEAGVAQDTFYSPGA